MSDDIQKTLTALEEARRHVKRAEGALDDDPADIDAAQSDLRKAKREIDEAITAATRAKRDRS